MDSTAWRWEPYSRTLETIQRSHKVDNEMKSILGRGKPVQKHTVEKNRAHLEQFSIYACAHGQWRGMRAYSPMELNITLKGFNLILQYYRPIKEMTEFQFI